MAARKQLPATICTAGAILLLIANLWRINLAINDEIGANWLSASTQTDLPQKRSVPRDISNVCGECKLEDDQLFFDCAKRVAWRVQRRHITEDEARKTYSQYCTESNGKKNQTRTNKIRKGNNLHAESLPAASENGTPPFSFSACLLIKDNNILLPEWLAYHYTFLPLRRLIVAVDPLSLTDPSPVLDLYKTIGMNITVWKNGDEYWKDGWQDFEKSDFVITNETDFATVKKRYVYRQRQFYPACMQQLKSEGRTWTTVVDTDEYVAFNYYDELEGPPSFCQIATAQGLITNTACEEAYLKQIRDGTHFRTKLEQSSTAAEFISRHLDAQFDNPEKPCLLLSRYLFVSKESEREDIQQEIGKGFNSSLFHTLRYHYRTPLNLSQLGKCIVDVSKYDGRAVRSPHILLGYMCTGTGKNGYAQNAANSFRVHHYVGSWESFRSPGFDARGERVFRERNNQSSLVLDNTTGYTKATAWLSRFVNLVGKDKALELTQNVRMNEERKMEALVDDQVIREHEINWSKHNNIKPK